MYPQIIVGYDGSDHADDALALAGLLAEAIGERLLLACVYPGGARARMHSAEAERVMRADAEEMLSKAAHGLEGAYEVETRAVPSMSNARGLHELAEREGADLIVVGATRDSAAAQLRAGSVAERLVHGSPCAVTIAPGGFREHGEAAIGTIGVAFDGSPEAGHALEAAVALAGATGAELHLLAVDEHAGAGEDPRIAEELRDQLVQDLEQATTGVKEKLAAEQELLEGDAAEAIAERARAGGIDLIVTGSRGYGPLRAVLGGSTSLKLLRAATCPVLVVPRGAEVPAAA